MCVFNSCFWKQNAVNADPHAWVMQKHQTGTNLKYQLEYTTVCQKGGENLWQKTDSPEKMARSWKLPFLVTKATPHPWFFQGNQFLTNWINKVHISLHQACCNRSKSSAATLARAACPAASSWLCRPHTWRVLVYWACKVSTDGSAWTIQLNYLALQFTKLKLSHLGRYLRMNHHF